MRNIKLTLEFDGTNYSGWQRQNNVMTVQQKLEEAIESIMGKPVEVTGSSRTDAGVHAKGFIANFHTESTINPYKLMGGINAKLPDDIVVTVCEEADSLFHSRYSSTGKTYSYSIINRSQPAAIGRNYAFYYRKNLNIQAMEEAAQYFLGTQDFSAFRNLGSTVKTSVRTITSIRMTKEGDLIRIFISGDGFLYNMVRIMVGTLIDVGTGKRNAEDIKKIILSRDRRNAAKVVPACGLCLEKVKF
jgi:tRNA pseudouridine38-40 synthase